MTCEVILLQLTAVPKALVEEIEAMIKKRIMEGVYDDVIRCIPLPAPSPAPSPAPPPLPLARPNKRANNRSPMHCIGCTDVLGRREAVAPKGIPRAAEELEFEKSEKGLGEAN